MLKCLKIYQLNIIKKVKKDYKRKLVKDIKVCLKKKKKKKRQYGREGYKNLSHVEKNKLVEYRKKYHRMRKYSNCSRTHNHLVHKRTLNHLAKLAK